MFQYIVAAAIVLTTAFYLYFKYKISYWRRLGVAEDVGYFPFGSSGQWAILLRKIPISHASIDTYKKFPDERIVGFYRMLGKPVLLIRDLDLAKRILIKDFDHFVNRNPVENQLGDKNSKNNKYVSQMLIALNGEKWKHMRSTMSPVFTSGKLKKLVPLIHKVGDECNKHLVKCCGKDINAKILMSDFSLDVIITTGFGIEINTFEDPDSILLKYAKRIIGKKISFTFMLSLLLLLVFPRIYKWLDLPQFFDPESMDFFVNLVKTSIKERRDSGTRRNDLIDFVIDAIEKESSQEEKENEVEQYDKDAELKDLKKEKHKYTQEELEVILISQALMMFVAAYEQVSNISSMILLYMANHQDIQDKLHKEISTMVQEYGSDKLDYASVMKLPYLEQVLHETLRHNPLADLRRSVTKNYKIPDTDLVLQKGMELVIPYPGIMKDEQYFKNPEEYNPDNFSEEAKKQRHPYAYSGFGHGPRNCIAMRFAMMQLKLVISRVLLSFKIVPCEKTVKEIIPDPKSRSREPIGGTWITVEKRSG